MWLYGSRNDGLPPIRLYDYQPGRGGYHADGSAAASHSLSHTATYYVTSHITCEYTVREDVLMSLENHNLTDAQAVAGSARSWYMSSNASGGMPLSAARSASLPFTLFRKHRVPGSFSRNFFTWAVSFFLSGNAASISESTHSESPSVSS